ncbi:ATP-binding protein [Microbulbifer sp. ALW1]|uniref:ATP-binding protein n=1 Tax=Microbulbifer sp. (strain ALW1) TaxID=1516059 RepID=UPI00135B6EBA|nr:ATP-binding protein [Microbulbifer sp. ALW1]
MKLRRQLILLSLCTLALPWAGCQYLRQVDKALSQGQMQTLEATGNAIAARLASAPELIAPDPRRNGRPPGAQLYLNPLPQAPVLDGYGEEWRGLALPPRQLLDQDGKPLAQVTLGRNDNQIYMLLTAKDRSPSYHDPRSSGISSGDTVQLYTARQQYTLPVASQGPVRALWYNPRRGEYERELRIRGRWTASPRGYQLELSMPFGLTDGELAIAVEDRTRSDGGDAPRHTSTLPADGRPGALVEPLRDLQQELNHFARPELQLTVVDKEGFVLASTGTDFADERQTSDSSGERHWLLDWLYRQILTTDQLPPLPRQYPESLTQNRDTAGQWFRAADEANAGDERIGAVSVPVVTRADDIIERPLLGRVIAAQSASALQSLTESAARRLWLTTAGAAGLVLLLLLGYASWLSWRIRRLHRAARNAVDTSGRLRGDFPQPFVNDELGALNRAFASLLAELDHYHQYLRSLAGKLSHELRTPLAVVRSSLDNLSAGELDSDSRRYAERAADGGARLSSILNALSAATHLEASISQAEREDFDLADLLQLLTQSYADAHPHHRFELQQTPAPPAQLHYHGAPELLAQLLDKLIDNAVSFAPDGSQITVSASESKREYRVSVSNDGPLLPEGFGQKLFDSLVSVRDDGGKAGHLGLGLHIARLIADFHGGQLSAANREDRQGVTFTLTLPR